jgi:hypothetical protein
MADILSGLLSYWPLNGNFNDYSSFNNYGTSYGSPAISFVPGRYGLKAAQLVAANSNYVDVGASTVFRFMTSKLTLAAWVYFTTLNADPDGSTVMTKNFSWYFDYINGSGLRFYGYGLSPAGCYSTHAITAGRWYFVAVTYDGAHVIIYVNNLTDSFNVTGTITENNGAGYHIGIGAALDTSGNLPSTYKRRLNGNVFKVYTYTRALAATDVTALYLGKRNLKLTQITQIPKFYNIPFRWNPKVII